ncbi:MAG: hypothetical protein MI717_01635 [Spirochaetales bacterium]|nr:hypothetical protein [Spirochaetales bacterium]
MSREDLILSIAEGKLSIDCIDLELIQCIDDSPVEIHGSGFITQTNEKHIEFKLLFKGKDTNIHDQLSFLSNAEPGSIVPKHHYFNLRGKDNLGKEWFAFEIYINTNIHISFNTAVITGEIDRLFHKRKYDGEDTDKHSLFIVSGNYNLPWNEYRTIGNHNTLSELNLKISGIQLNIYQEENLLNVHLIVDESSDLQAYKNSIIQALSIMTGVKLPILYELDRENNKIQTQINSFRFYIDGKLDAPIKIWMPFDIHKFSNFLETYLNFSLNNNSSRLFGFWHRIFCVSKSLLESSALASSVAVEGMVKKYFCGYFPVSADEIHTIENATKTIKGLTLDKDIQSKLLSSLNNFKTKSPKTVLNQICHDNNIDPNLIKTWSALRNKSAHSDDNNMSQSQFDKFYHDYKSILFLFYQLIFLTIGYKEKFLDYSQIGCPEKKFHSGVD